MGSRDHETRSTDRNVLSLNVQVLMEENLCSFGGTCHDHVSLATVLFAEKNRIIFYIGIDRCPQLAYFSVS